MSKSKVWIAHVCERERSVLRMCVRMSERGGLDCVHV